MNEMKFIPADTLIDEVYGKIGTPERDAMEARLAEELSAAQRADNPSPSGDAWFDDYENMDMVRRGVSQIEQGRCKSFTVDESRRMLGV